MCLRARVFVCVKTSENSSLYTAGITPADRAEIWCALEADEAFSLVAISLKSVHELLSYDC